jgi:hypothetical protein
MLFRTSANIYQLIEHSIPRSLNLGYYVLSTGKELKENTVTLFFLFGPENKLTGYHDVTIEFIPSAI